MKNKKAQLFTILAIFLIILMFLSFEFFSFLQKDKSVRTRVSTMDAFLFSVEENLERQVYISGFRIIFLAENQIISTGSYINDVDSFFTEAFFNSTVNGQPETSILPGVTYDDLVDSLNSKAAKINVIISLNNSVFSVNQNDPWNVDITLVSDFVMEDMADLAKWEKVQTISATIPVTFFWDPVSIVSRSARKINRTTYIENPNAPSFLKMLEGDLTSDVNGIEFS